VSGGSGGDVHFDLFHRMCNSYIRKLPKCVAGDFIAQSYGARF
jgi:hypothetical protein